MFSFDLQGTLLNSKNTEIRKEICDMMCGLYRPDERNIVIISAVHADHHEEGVALINELCKKVEARVSFMPPAFPAFFNEYELSPKQSKLYLIRSLKIKVHFDDDGEIVNFINKNGGTGVKV